MALLIFPATFQRRKKKIKRSIGLPFSTGCTRCVDFLSARFQRGEYMQAKKRCWISPLFTLLLKKPKNTHHGLLVSLWPPLFRSSISVYKNRIREEEDTSETRSSHAILCFLAISDIYAFVFTFFFVCVSLFLYLWFSACGLAGSATNRK